jgi:DNA replication protein DnaC
MSDTPTPTVDTARLPVLLSQLRLATVALLWPALTETADRESWPAAKTLAALMEHEVAERARRRTARHLLEARLPAGKTLDRFDFTAVSSISKARVIALAEGDSWLDQGTNILLFGPPGVGKSHLAAALGHAMVDAGYRVLFTRTTDLVQQLQAARQELRLATAIEKLDKYHLLVLDDLSYVRKSQAETSVIFELISARYERRSLLVTANRPFGSWDSIFPDPAMTVAAIDRRLVHYSIILEMNTDSYRRKSAEMKLRKKSTTASAKDALNEPSPPSEIA